MSDDGQHPSAPGRPAPAPQAASPYAQPASPPPPAQPQYAPAPQYGTSPHMPYGHDQSYPAGAPVYPAPVPPVIGGGLAIAALIVGIVAFVTGWVPIFGLLVAIAGIVLGILAVRRPVRRGFGWTAIVLSALAMITNVVVLAVLYLGPMLWLAHPGSVPFPPVPSSSSEEDSSTGDAQGEVPDESTFSVVGGQVIDTPCWSYDGPTYFVNNIDAASVEDCVGKLELWGEWQGDVFVPTGAGATAGQIVVDPQQVAQVETVAPGSDVDAFVDAVEQQFGYFSGQGEIISLHEATTIGGAPANITRIDSTAETTKTKAFITVLAPQAYDAPSGQVQMFIISVTTPYENGEEQLQQVIDTWTWK